MADIFGRQPWEYSHIAEAQRLGVWDAHCDAVRSQGEIAHDFDALGRGAPPGLERAESAAQAVGYLTNNLQALIGVVQNVLYLNTRLTDHVPVRMDVAEGATSYLHRVFDRAGRGRFITTDGTDAPTAGAAQRTVAVQLAYGGIDAAWSVEDLRRAMFGNFPLDMELLSAAAQGAVDHIESVAFSGDTDMGWTGLINQPVTGANKVTLTTLSSETFSTRTAAQIVERLQTQVGKLVEDTKEVLPRVLGGELDIVLPTAQFNQVVTMPLGDNSDKSVWDYVRNYNAWTARGGMIMLRSMPELDGAGASNTDRMLLYVKRTEVLEQAHAISPRVLRVMDQGRVVKAQMEYKVGPLFVGRPSTVQYVDGV